MYFVICNSGLFILVSIVGMILVGYRDDTKSEILSCTGGNVGDRTGTHYLVAAASPLHELTVVCSETLQ